MAIEGILLKYKHKTKNNPETVATGTCKACNTVPELLGCCWCSKPFFQHPEMLSVAVAPLSEQICMTVYCLFDPQTAALEKEQSICV